MKRALFVFLCAAALGSCAKEKTMTVTSSAVDENGFIADMYGYNDPENLDAAGMPIYSIPFEVINAPEETVSFALMLEDKDAFPVSQGFSWIHWAAANIKTTSVPAGASQNAPDFVQGVNSWWSIQGGSRNAEEVSCYGGPAPYDGKVHVYELHVYALDCELPLENGFLMNEMFHAMEGHVLAACSMKAKYQLKNVDGQAE